MPFIDKLLRRSALKNRIGVLALLSLAVGSMYGGGMLAFGAIMDYDAMRGAIGGASIPYLVGAFVCILAIYPVHGVRWSQLMRAPGVRRVPFREAIGFQASATVLNVLLPALGGDLAVSWYLRRERSVPISVSLTASGYSRFSGLVAAVSLCAAATWSVSEPTTVATVRAGALATLVLGCLVTSVALFPGTLYRVGRWLEGLARTSRRDGDPSGWRRKLGDFVLLLGWCIHVTLTRGYRWVLASFGWSLASFVIHSMALQLMARALQIDMSFPAACCIISAGALAGITSIVVATAGVAELAAVVSLVVALTGVGLPEAAALVFVLSAMRWGSVALVLVLAYPTLSRMRERDTEAVWSSSFHRPQTSFCSK